MGHHMALFAGIGRGNSHRAGMKEKLDNMKANQDGWNRDEFLSKYPEVFNIVGDEVQVHNNVTGNVFVNHDRVSNAIYGRDLDYPTATIDGNYLVPGNNKARFYDEKFYSSPPYYEHRTLEEWRSLYGFDVNSQEIGGGYELLLNKELVEKDMAVSGNWCFVDGTSAGNSVRVGPRQSVVLVDCSGIPTFSLGEKFLDWLKELFK